MFGVKDVFTTINILGGVAAMALCIDGRPYEAGLAILFGYLLGDTLDGWVARKLGSANAFGAEYDTIADHNAHIIAPATVVYTVYRDAALLPGVWGHVLAGALAASIVVAASVRHARNIVRPVKFAGIWAGLPRSVLGFLSIAYVNASLAPYAPGGLWLGVALIPILCWSTLTYLPFPNHHIARRHRTAARVAIAGFFVTTFGAVVVAPRFVFDILFFWMAGYSLGAWIALTAEERRAFRETVRSALVATPT